MKGRNHVLITWGVVLPVLYPIISIYPVETVLAFITLTLGCLTPDIDIKTSTLFKGGKSLQNGVTEPFYVLFGSFLFPFALFMRYLVAKPGQLLVGVTTENELNTGHRGFTHTLPGLVSVITILGFYASVLLLYLNIYEFQFLFVGLIGFTFGYILHLLQDSLTKSGILWIHPFSEIKLRGSLKTGKSKFKIGITQILLSFALVSSILLTHSFGFSKIQGSLVSGSIVFGIWVGLSVTIFGLRIERDS